MGLPIIIYICLFFVSLASASSALVPVKLQAALFRKILSYDTKLKGKSGELVVLLVSDDNKQVNEVALSFSSAGFKVNYTSVVGLKDAAQEADVLYVTPNIKPLTYKELCENQGLLSITGDSQLVEKGHVSVGLKLKEDGRPQIIVNIKRLQAEQHELQSTLLTLVKVIR